jgi:alpha-mannosidase
VLPQLLVRLGFTGALHANLDDGQFPRAEQSKFRWEGVDSSALDAVARIPLDASRPESFLGLPTKMGETMDLDHVATMVFAHWPGQSSVWYDDLRRMSDYVPVLGKFVTAGEYFDQTQTSGRISKFKPDTYRAPYLKQAVIRKQPNPLSRFVEHYRRQALASGIEALETLVTLLRPGDGNAPPIGTSLRDVMTRDDDALQDALREATQSLAQVLPREQPGSDARRGSFIANPLSFSRRVGIELPAEMALPNVSGPVQAAQQQAGRKVAVVEVPAMGFAWIGPGAGEAPPPKPAAGGFWSRLKPGSAKTGDKSLVEGSTLRNEHMEVVIDERSGGIRALNDYRTRGNRLSQQLAFRLPSPRPKPGDVWHDPDLDAAYSSMVAQSVEVTASGPALGEIVTSGELRDPEGKRLAGYRQTYQLWRGSQVLLVQVELDVAEEPRVDPWNSYYAARFAWADETAELRRSVSWGGHATQAKRLESPLYVEMQTEKTRTAVLCGGLPYHRRVGDRMLDTLLVVRCETARRFRLGIGLDLSYPLPAALELLNPPLVVDDVGVSPKPAASSWLFHLDAKNIVATHWSPLVEEGRVAGFVVRLLETEGRAGRAKLRSFRPVARARQTDLRGETLADLRTEEDAVQLDFTAHEWLQIEARW